MNDNLGRSQLELLKQLVISTTDLKRLQQFRRKQPSGCCCHPSLHPSLCCSSVTIHIIYKIINTFGATEAEMKVEPGKVCFPSR